MTTLFVNACMRGEESRTLALCREYLAGKQDVVEVDLAKLRLAPFDAEMVAHRTEKQLAGEWDDPVFALSRQFAQAGRHRGGRAVLGSVVPGRAQDIPRARERVRVHLPLHRRRPMRGPVPRAAPHLHHHVRRTRGGGQLRLRVFVRHREDVRHPSDAFRGGRGSDVVGVDVEAQMDKARAQLAALRAAEGERR